MKNYTYEEFNKIANKLGLSDDELLVVIGHSSNRESLQTRKSELKNDNMTFGVTKNTLLFVFESLSKVNATKLAKQIKKVRNNETD